MNNAEEEKDKHSAMENSGFKGRIDKVFGALFQLSSSSDGGWRLSDEQVPKKQWKRDESASAREDMPCGSSFDGLMDMGAPRGRTNKKSQWEGDFGDSDDDERKAGEGSAEGNKGEDEEENEARGMRFVVGMDSTLDQEDEEDEFDKVAVGREDAGERTYMKEIMDTGPKINSHNALPSSLNELKYTGRDPRANHYAARARLEEDDEEAAAAHPDSEMVDKLNLGNKEECSKLNDGKENSELLHSNNGSEKENVTDSLPMEELKPKTGLKSIMKGKKRQTEVQQDMEKESPPVEEAVSGLGTFCPMDDFSIEKPKKRVRFDPGINGDPAGQLEKKHDLIKVVNSRKRSFVRGVGSSNSLQNGYSRVPDYIRNPSKYIHYTLDWSNEDDDMINMQAFNEFSQLVKPSASAQLGDSAEIPKSVTFIPRKRALCTNKTREASIVRSELKRIFPAMALHFVCVCVAVLLPLALAVGVQHGTLESVPELEKAMYVGVNGTPCVRLLNLSGEIGCANPGRVKITAPLRRLEKARDKLDQRSAILLPLHEFDNFLNRILDEPRFAQHVAGLLLEYEPRNQFQALGFSPDNTFPQAEFAPYKNKTYQWNPVGSGILHHSYDFPVFMLSQESTEVLQKASASNKRQNFKYPINVAEFDLVMQTTKSGTHDSRSCLEEGSCLPLGGYSVWSSLPPINVSSSSPKKPIILAIAAMDSMSFFRDKTLGADSPLSGLIALLTAVDALSHVDGASKWEKQLVFLVVTGEAWGYLGSRRFLAELNSSADSVNGLSSELIEQVVEVGSVGKAMVDGIPTFFAHDQQDSDRAKAILKALEQAAASFGSESIKVKKASTSNPGIPPSSLMSFLNKDPSTPGIVLEDFNTTFTNEFYHSQLDDLLNINSTSIVAAASVVSRALYILANNGSGSNTIMQSINVNESLVEELLECLLSCEPGLSCRLVNDLITPTQVCPNHYVGVLLGAPSSSLYPDYVDDTSQFVWNFLADRTSIPRVDSMPCSRDCTNSSEVCVGSRVDHKGVCMISTTRYVPAYSTRLSYESDAWKVIPVQDNDEMGMVDPVWTESFWKSLGIRVYIQQSTFFDEFILLSGLGVTVGSFIAIICTKTILIKALKHD